jgi:hypothetical protein
VSPFLDATTSTLRSTLRLVAAHYPLRLLAGLSAGIVLDGLLEVAAAGALDRTMLRAAADLHVGYSAALGVLASVASIVMSRNRLSDAALRDLDLVEQIIERGGLSDLDRRIAWRTLLTKAVEAYRPGGGRLVNPARLAEEAIRELRDTR